jgi:threonine dehydratase
VAIGGGGLIAGVAAYVKAVRPDIKIIGVQTTDSDAMARSLKAGRAWRCRRGPVLGRHRRQAGGRRNLPHRRELVDEIIIVDTDAICAAIKDIFQDTRSIVEPAGALAVAGAKAYVERARQQEADQGRDLVTIACGANMNFDRLRFVAERPRWARRAKRSSPSPSPKSAAASSRFCEAVGPRNVTEFNYRISDAKAAHVRRRPGAAADEAGKIARNFEKAGFGVLDLTHDELAKATSATWSAARATWPATSCCTASSSRSARAR